MPLNGLDSILEENRGGVWFVAGHAEPRAVQKLAKGAGFAFFHVEGKNIGRKEQLLNHVATALHFPGDFGHNWDALADVLEDRDWLGKRGRVVVLAHVAVYRKDHPTDCRMLEEILGEASEFWQERHVPFWVFVQGI